MKTFDDYIIAPTHDGRKGILPRNLLSHYGTLPIMLYGIEDLTECAKEYKYFPVISCDCDIIEERISLIKRYSNEKIQFGVGISFFDSKKDSKRYLTELDIASCAFESGASLLFIDTPYCAKVNPEFVDTLRSRFQVGIDIVMGGNFSQYDADYSYGIGCDSIFVGDSLNRDTTRNYVFGVGFNPRNSEVDCLAEISNNTNIFFNPGNRFSDWIKAYLLGADFLFLNGIASPERSYQLINGAFDLYGVDSWRELRHKVFLKMNGEYL